MGPSLGVAAEIVSYAERAASIDIDYIRSKAIPTGELARTIRRCSGRWPYGCGLRVHNPPIWVIGPLCHSAGVGK
jgi:hypothetical protein